MEYQEEISDPISEIALKIFGIRYLYPFQRLVVSNIAETAYIKNILSESDNRLKDRLDFLNRGINRDEIDSRPYQMVILPTGAGKSLCFMLPSFFLKNLTVIVFPLLSLMDDQYRRCREAGISAAVLKGGMKKDEKSGLMENIEKGRIRVLITNPENLLKAEIPEILKNRINHFVIDEAHIVSQWGDSFRPAYGNITSFINKTEPDIITAFTATASEGILKRIREIVFPGRDCHLVSQLSDRKNIYYSVRKPINKFLEIIRIISLEKNLPAIVFCSSRTGAEINARRLILYTGNPEIRFYHAGMTCSEKTKIENWFFSSSNGILCSTCAYGMGIDKKNIRTVIHFDLPSTIESYLQESGRAGRDGMSAESIILLSYSDIKEISETGNIHDIFKDDRKCRRQVYLSLLGQEMEFCSGCDVCNNQVYTDNVQEFSLKKFIKEFNGNFTLDEAAAILLGRIEIFSRLFTAGASYKYFGLLHDWDEKELKDFLLSGNTGSCAFICNTGFWKSRIMSGSKFPVYIKKAEIAVKSFIRKLFLMLFGKIFSFIKKISVRY